MAKFLAVLAIALATQGDAPPTPFWNDPDVVRCSPTVVSQFDTIVLSKQSTALRELAVLRPEAKVAHFLVVDLPPENMSSLMSPDQLASATEVRISVAELVGLEWSAGASPELVFTVPGTYQLWLSTNLESEEGAYVCKLRYQPSR